MSSEMSGKDIYSEWSTCSTVGNPKVVDISHLLFDEKEATGIRGV